MPKPSRKRAILSAALIIIVFIAGSIFWKPGMNHLTSKQVRTAYAQENTALGSAIQTLGLTGAAREVFQCYPARTALFRTYEICENFTIYPYTFHPISAEAQANYPKNAAKLEQLLKDRGWTIDRPQDRIKTLVDSNPYSDINGGEGGEVPYHKNIGPVSCNLRLNFSGLSDMTSPAALNLNEFSCSQGVSYPDFNVHPRHYNTV